MDIILLGSSWTLLTPPPNIRATGKRTDLEERPLQRHEGKSVKTPQ